MRSRTEPNLVNTVDDSRHRLDSEPKTVEQPMKCDSVHYRVTETSYLDHGILVEYDESWPSIAVKLQDKMHQ